VTSTRVIVEADGGARGNPGPAGFGAVVRDPVTGEVIAERSGFLGVATNNAAEYQGLIAGLRAAADLGAREVSVRMDSKLVVEQMSGRWQIRHPSLRPLAAQAAALVAGFETVRFTWIPRERNTLADGLANAAMDAGVAPAEPAPKAPPVSWAPRSDAATRLVLVRHGETALTAQGRYSGRGDPELSEHGREQARAAARRVVALAPAADLVVSSPLSRCTGTAAPIAEALDGAVLRTEADLIECDFGQWEGLTYAEVREGWPAEHDRWLSSPAVAPPDGESFRTVAARVERAVTRLRDAHPGRTVVVVSHVTPIKLILKEALGGGDSFLYRLYLDAAGVSTVDYWPDGGVAVRLVNDTSHLS
jgi:probable phosphoglycerate mutase